MTDSSATASKRAAAGSNPAGRVGQYVCFHKPQSWVLEHSGHLLLSNPQLTAPTTIALILPNYSDASAGVKQPPQFT